MAPVVKVALMTASNARITAKKKASLESSGSSATAAVVAPALEASIKSGNERILSLLNPKEQFTCDASLAPFLDQLCLQESDCRAKLQSVLSHKAQPKAFERVFFETWFQVKKDAYARLSMDEMQALAMPNLSPVLVDSMLDALFSPSLDDKQLEQMKYPESILSALILTGSVSLYRHPRLLSFLVNLQYTEALSHLFICIRDVPDAQQAQFLGTLIKDSKLNTAIRSRCGDDFDAFVLNFLAKPKSPILMKRYFSAMPTDIIISIFKLIENYLVNYETLPNKGRKLQKNTLLCPSREALLDWLSLLMDSQYPLCLLNQDLVTCFSSVSVMIKAEMQLSNQLENIVALSKSLKPLSKAMAKKNNLQPAGALYRVEMANL